MSLFLKRLNKTFIQTEAELTQYLSEEINEESLMNLHIIGTLHNCETFTNPVQAVAFSLCSEYAIKCMDNLSCQLLKQSFYFS